MIEFRALSLFKERVETLPVKEQFEKIAMLFYGAKYKMGSENMRECDCSGLICSTLVLMGFKIRINANDIMTKLVDEEFHETSPILIGCKKDGKFKHIGIVLIEGETDIVFNASHPSGTRFESLEKFRSRYTSRGYTTHEVYLNWEKVAGMHGVAYELDKEFI